MAGLFAKLFPIIASRGQSVSAPPAKSERIRQTAADEHHNRKLAADISAENAGGFASLKAKLARQSAAALESIGKAPIAAIERARAERLEAQAALERERRMAPEERFLAGQIRLTYGADFQSSTPQKPPVYQMWYVPGHKEIWVRYFDNTGGSPIPGSTYKYWTVTTDEASRMYRATTKGHAIWAEFRVKGSKTAHRKNYARVS